MKPDGAGRPSPIHLGRAAALLLLLLTATGCASWHVSEQAPSQVFALERPQRVRVTTEGGEQTVLVRPRVVGEVLAGYDAECIARIGRVNSDCEETGVPIFEISVFEVQKRGLAAVILPAVVGIGTTYLVITR